LSALTGPLAPLSVPVFRRIWLASIASNFGGLVQAVGAAWMMTLISDSDAMVALVQASTTLPIMVFSLVAGAVADSYDRRRVMLVSQAFMFSVSVALTAFAFLDWLNAWLLLTFTFLIGCGMAFNNPAWQASVRDFVGKELLSAAVLLNGVGFNVTRSVAPAVGGTIVAAAGATAAFLVNAVSYLGLIFAVWTWQGPERSEDTRREPLRSAVGSGLRYVTLSPNLMRIYLRGFLFGLAAVVVLALLPLIARDMLDGDSLTFGLLLGAFGVGAVFSGLSSARISRILGNESMVRVSFLGVALATAAISFSSVLPLTMLAVALAGAAWVQALALFNTSVQLTTPRWVVGRALSFYQMFTFGGMALGSWLWGAVVESLSVVLALQAAAATTLVGLAVGFRWPVPPKMELDLEPLGRWQEPPVGMDILPRSGPVSVAVEYLIDEADVPAFTELMFERRRIRRRDGARQWTLLNNIEQRQQWIERFELPTWAAYVRMHGRTTQEDGRVGARIRALHRGEMPPRVRRMLVREPGPGRVQSTVERPPLDV
jgi:MFS family permease